MTGTLRKQYFFRESQRGMLAWDVDKLIRATAGFPRRRVPLDDVPELDRAWHGAGEAGTWRDLVEHVKLMDEADLSYPIILAANGEVMDGRHRLAQSLRTGRADIECVQFDADPPPDHVGLGPDDLPY